MPTAVPERGRLTDHLVSYLETSAPGAWVVGDGSVPAGAGWAGQPQTSLFKASVVVRTEQASPNARDTIAGRHASWVARYSLRSVGVVRKQADDVADEVRQLVLGFTLPAGPFATAWSLTDIVFGQLGAVNKVGNDENATFEVSDVVDLWIDRKRA